MKSFTNDPRVGFRDPLQFRTQIFLPFSARLSSDPLTEGSSRFPVRLSLSPVPYSSFSPSERLGKELFPLSVPFFPQMDYTSTFAFFSRNGSASAGSL